MGDVWIHDKAISDEARGLLREHGDEVGSHLNDRFWAAVGESDLLAAAHSLELLHAIKSFTEPAEGEQRN